MPDFDPTFRDKLTSPGAAPLAKYRHEKAPQRGPEGVQCGGGYVRFAVHAVHSTFRRTKNVRLIYLLDLSSLFASNEEET
jgi:hypothetical protein